MTDEPPFDPLLLDRFLTGDLPEPDRERVDRWFAAHPKADVLRHAPRVALGAASAADTDASWQRLSSRLAADAQVDELAHRRADRSDVPAPRVSTQRAWSRRAIRIAAALAVVLGGTALWRAVGDGRGGNLVAPPGRDVSATLPDGSRLTLAAGSRATWSGRYGVEGRDILLEGEAYFDVVHDTTQSFRVRTRGAVAEDIGTRFVVRGWPELAQVEVAVDEGLVALGDTVAAHAASRTTLRAGERGTLYPDGRVTVTDDGEAVLAWTRGHLVFDDQPLATVLPSIGRRFDVTITADPSLAGRRLSARFTSQSLREVLDAIALSLDVRIETDGRMITLLPASR